MTNPYYPQGGPSLKGMANLIKSSDTKNIIIMAGAGISTSAVPPIPDFRSPSTGLYANLAKYDLPYPEAIFDISYFHQKPQPFFTLSKELYPGKFKPSLAHVFFKLLHDKGKLLTVFTQNVDTLERIAGLPPSSIVEAHGSFASSTCTKCKRKVDESWMKEKVLRGEIAYCPHPKCPSALSKVGAHSASSSRALVKPDIVFFGEGLPKRFFEKVRDFKSCDLLIVMGTSLQVEPFASLINAVPESCPRALINLERVGELAAYSGHGMSSTMREEGFDFEGCTLGGKHMARDFFFQGKADDSVRLLARECGWEEELQALLRETYDRLDREWGLGQTQSQNDTVTAPAGSASTDQIDDLDVLASKLGSTGLGEAIHLAKKDGVDSSEYAARLVEKHIRDLIEKNQSENKAASSSPSTPHDNLPSRPLVVGLQGPHACG
ncbi:NAD-dependent deacetylase sirtuin-2 [Violaceomyces palustris]|uniref:NAD-dependent deacetylase sirtuin-2 n=1 Tax=Violaceomyces palustris TaxID=1673888 RepID=A0ACD0NTX4_9BASI|nr:NAD-dependent deacetylase sirtuin-2 [Violaceomyces palustris]